MVDVFYTINGVDHKVFNTKREANKYCTENGIDRSNIRGRLVY